MKKSIQILALAILISCNHSDKQASTKVEEKVKHSDDFSEEETKVNPILEFNQFVKAGKIERAKNVILKFGINYKDENSRNFYSTAVRENIELTRYLLDNGYIMNSTEKYQLFEMTKSDTSLFSNLYIEHIKDIPSISSAVIHNCDINLLKYYLKTVKPDLSKCSYNLSGMSYFHCSCITNHCESNSVDLLEILLDYNKTNFPIENSCMIENWIQEYPKLADSLLVKKLIQNDLIQETDEWTPLINYCRWNNNNIVELLLKNGYNPNWNNSSDLLYFAITRVGDGLGEHLTKENRNQTVELLLKSGANPNLKIKENIGVDGERINFVEFAANWKFEDNTELVNIVNEYAR